MWQSQVEIKHYSVAYCNRITVSSMELPLRVLDKLNILHSVYDQTTQKIKPMNHGYVVLFLGLCYHQ